MAFQSQDLYDDLANTKVDIVGIPAIGALPEETFAFGNGSWLGPSLRKEIPEARVLLYDHYTRTERASDARVVSVPQYSDSSTDYATVQHNIAELGIDEWADRLVAALHQCRSSKQLQQRPIVFICHSTGGIVLKAALTRKVYRSQADLAGVCILVCFFSTPHHGSRVLSRPEFARPLQHKYNLKWEMSPYLRSQFALRNPDLAFLNHSFGSKSLGIRIWSYLETSETQLNVRTEYGTTSVSQLVVDPQSAEMTNSLENDLVEEEDVYYLNANHAGTARLGDDAGMLGEYISDLRKLIRSTNAQERAIHHELIQSIFHQVEIGIHQFYQIEVSAGVMETKIWTEKADLGTFLESGPSTCLRRRLLPYDQRRAYSNGTLKSSSDFSSLFETPTSAADWPLVDSRTTMAPSPSPSLYPSITSPDNASQQRYKSPVPRQPAANDVQFSPRSHSDGFGIELANRSEPAQQPTRPRYDMDQQLRMNTSSYQGQTFQVPTKDTHRFMWLHVPACISGFVPKIMSSISRDKGTPDLHSKLLIDQLWMAHHNKSRHASSHAYFVRPYCKVLMPKGITHDEILSPSSATDEMQLAFFMPYLHWDTFDEFTRRAKIIKSRSEQPYARPVDRRILRGESLENKLVWQFLNSRSPIHCRRTTDQYGYSTLRNTEARDLDQVLYKQTLNKATESATSQDPVGRLDAQKRNPSRQPNNRAGSNDAACMLMVDQLWLWVLGNDTLLTFAAPKESGDDRGGAYLQADIRQRIYNDVHGDYAHQVEDCFDFAALTVLHCVKALLEHTDNPNLQVFRIFEEFISELTEAQVNSFKEFQGSHRETSSNTAKLFDNSADLDALLELRDIQDELNTIKKLLGEQHSNIRDMTRQYVDIVNQQKKGIHGTVLLREADHAITIYEEQLEGMLKSSAVAENAFEQLLDMKQKHASIIEAHIAREMGEVTAEQSRSVMIFTIFTVIFLPLSFFASIFGMNVREWSGVDSNPTFGVVFRYMGPISLAVTVFSILVAFNKHTRRLLRFMWHITASPCGKRRKREHEGLGWRPKDVEKAEGSREGRKQW